MRITHVFAPALATAIISAAAGGAIAADQADVQALSRSKMSLTQAIEAAEQQGRGGKAIDAEFEADDKGTRYEIKVLGPDSLVTYTMDADTGKVLDTSNEPVEKFFTRLKPENVRGSRTTLAQAIGIAEQRTGGKAMEAEVDREGDVVRYDVTTVKADGSEHEVYVDAAGKIAESR
jgi:uncharacterized membrane protein YkoI